MRVFRHRQTWQALAALEGERSRVRFAALLCRHLISRNLSLLLVGKLLGHTQWSRPTATRMWRTPHCGAHPMSSAGAGSAEYKEAEEEHAARFICR